MNRSDPEAMNTNGLVMSSIAQKSAPNPRLLLVTRAIWLALVIPCLGLFVLGLPAYYQQLQKAQMCGASDCLNAGLTGKDLQTLSAHGFSVSGYAAVFTVFFAILAAVWCLVGFLLFWRRSDDRLALLAAFALVMGGITFGGTYLYALVLTFPIFDFPVTLVQFLGSASSFVFVLFFPNGRLVPRWMGLILLLAIIFAFIDTFPSTGAHFDANWLGNWYYAPVNFVVYGAIIFSQIYRYRRVSTLIQRQQTKWVVFGVAVAFGTFIGLLLLSGLIPSFTTLFANVGWDILPIAFLAIPLSIGFSISRYRLYDIDTLINRTLVYGALTLSLALVYVGLVTGLQSLAHVLTGVEQSPVVIVVSTLAIAAFFQPLRRRIQAIIDRRFYRRKYDAAKTVEAFSATLRDEVDLQQLCEHLTVVIQETMQPAHISLWLRPGIRETSWNANPPLPKES